MKGFQSIGSPTPSSTVMSIPCLCVCVFFLLFFSSIKFSTYYLGERKKKKKKTVFLLDMHQTSIHKLAEQKHKQLLHSAQVRYARLVIRNYPPPLAFQPNFELKSTRKTGFQQIFFYFINKKTKKKKTKFEAKTKWTKQTQQGNPS